MAAATCVGITGWALQTGAWFGSLESRKIQESGNPPGSLSVASASSRLWMRRRRHGFTAPWRQQQLQQPLVSSRHRRRETLELGLGFCRCPCRASKQQEGELGYMRYAGSSRYVAMQQQQLRRIASLVVGEESPHSLKTAAAKGSKSGRGQEWGTVVDTDEEGSLRNADLLPKPPAGFILDDAGKVVLMAPTVNRVVRIVDPATGRALDCMVRRAFRSSEGEQCLLLLPLDMPLQIFRIEDSEGGGLTELSDAELEEVLPSASFALVKKRLHLVRSGFCLTARGGFCYTDEDVMDLNTEQDEGLGGSLAEGVEIASFQVGESEYLMYTPFDPLMFVARKDESTGELIVADDELLDDEAVLDAIDEENDFQSTVDEEEAINEALKKAK
ncbi:unnamed protein product [Sphagnum troendelagicum]|uniref:DUF295 domain-containing protein n=1 Tax=Sphagnum troendelagicum TaxID=128251 RepID=A0ABP0UAB9_9BRYO